MSHVVDCNLPGLMLGVTVFLNLAQAEMSLRKIMQQIHTVDYQISNEEMANKGDKMSCDLYTQECPCDKFKATELCLETGNMH